MSYAEALGLIMLFGMIAVIFIGVAGPMAATSYLNSRLVERMGTRRISHIGLVFFLAFAWLHLILAWQGKSLAMFILMQGLTVACFGLASANFGALAMQPLGHVAGTASSVQGTIGTIGGAVLGTLVGQNFDGSVVPLVAGFAGYGAAAFMIVLITERGRLFRRGRDEQVPAPVSEVL